jgi:predicted  nucleic acid-binding Zn-ribbon protein
MIKMGNKPFFLTRFFKQEKGLFSYSERRKYLRLNSCFPVEFSLFLSPESETECVYQGFTQDISEGGICLQARNLSPEVVDTILNKRPKLNLLINIPIWAEPAKARVDIVWIKKDDKAKGRNSLHIGLSYASIHAKDRARIINYARSLKWLPRIAGGVLALLFLAFIALYYAHTKTCNENRELVTQLVHVSEAKAGIERQLNEIKTRKEMLDLRLSKGAKTIVNIESQISEINKRFGIEKQRIEELLSYASVKREKLERDLADLTGEGIASDDIAFKVIESRISKIDNEVESLNMELSEVLKKTRAEKQALENRLAPLVDENTQLQNQISAVETGAVLLEEQLNDLRGRSNTIEKASIERMLEWIKLRQVKRTGLVLSYEGDDSLKDWGFTYDQALAVQVFLITGQTERAKNILDFFNARAEKSGRLFYNAYDIKTATPREYTVHSGPNIWIAISACQYVNKTKDFYFIGLAQDIAEDMISMQSASDDKGIRGGPNVNWVSTEHNLDAYALFTMLYELTREQKYASAAEHALQWLKNSGYNKSEGRFLRGKGDATIATDTFSWSIAALGPEVLSANGMDPDRIMEFAETECRVETKFYRPEGKAVDITGFDFAKASNIGRGGIVSTEWTAQMAGAFKIMADYYGSKMDMEKQRIYNFKAEYYLSQLGKMVVSSPSPTGQGQGCLPYASIDNVDTGHGWRVANGRRTGSVAGTAYYIFAYKGHNPLGFE